jgi:hypothetical protein
VSNRCPQRLNQLHTNTFAEAVLRWIYSDSSPLDSLEGFSNCYIAAIEQWRLANFLQLPMLETGLLQLFLDRFKSSFQDEEQYIYPRLQLSIDSQSVVRFVEGLKNACTSFGPDQENELFDLLIRACLSILPLLTISMCFAEWNESKNGKIFAHRVYTNYYWGNTEINYSRNFRNSCWGCDASKSNTSLNRVGIGKEMILCTVCEKVVESRLPVPLLKEPRSQLGWY